MKIRMLVLTCLLLGSAVQAQDEGPEVTEDGLVRVPSSRNVGVYRLPEATFNQYQRVQIAPIKVEFKKGWERNHREMNEKDLQKLRGQLAFTYREELIKELVNRGGYKLAKEATPDTLRVSASILQADITAPKASADLAERTLVRTAGSMKLVVELHDAASGVLIARLIDYAQPPEYREPRLATEISNLADFRVEFESSARYTHEALAVARSAKREEQSQIKTGN
jgi:uncharacterized protein DUF3313